MTVIITFAAHDNVGRDRFLCFIGPCSSERDDPGVVRLVYKECTRGRLDMITNVVWIGGYGVLSVLVTPPLPCSAEPFTPCLRLV